MLQAAPAIAASFHALGQAHESGGELEAAQAAYEMALTLDPRHASSLISQGEQCHGLGVCSPCLV